MSTPPQEPPANVNIPANQMPVKRVVSRLACQFQVFKIPRDEGFKDGGIEMTTVYTRRALLCYFQVLHIFMDYLDESE